MPSIFQKTPPAQPDYKKDLLETETTILKRLNTFIDETTNKWKSTNDWIKKTGDQVNELLKRTFDLQRKVEGQLIDVENTAKTQFHRYDEKLDAFEKRMNGKYITVKDHNEKIDVMAGVIRGLESKIKEQNDTIQRVEGSIPRGTVSSSTLETIVAELRNTDEKIANAIPKNVASADLVSDIRKEIIAKFEPYATVEAVKSVQKAVEDKITKVAKVSSDIKKDNKDTRTEFSKLASKVASIEKDYVSLEIVPQVKAEINKVSGELSQSIGEVESKIPTDYANLKQIDLVREYQKDLEKKIEVSGIKNGQALTTTHSNIQRTLDETRNDINTIINDFKTTLAETVIGEDVDYIKNIIRELTDEEIRHFRNTAEMFQGNMKQKVLEVKNQNKNIALKINELQSDFNKLILLNKRK